MSNGQTPAGSPPPPPPQGSVPPPPPPSTPSYGGNTAGGAGTGGNTGGGGLLILVVIAGFALLGWGAKKGMDRLKEEGVDLGAAVEAMKDAENNPSAAVEAIIALNPEIETVKNDPETGRITIRNTKTGEEATFDYSEIQEGRFTFESDQGSYSVDASAAQEGEGITFEGPDGQTARIGAGTQNVPPWLPVYPDVQAEGGGFTSETGDKASGLVVYKSSNSLEDVEAWYTEKLEAEGYTIERSAVDMGGNRQVVLQARKEGIDTLAVALGREQGAADTSITLTYEGPKG
ncbi:MAG: hypothetical protein MI919_03755 [Holophagales bacterium]|nr:hypothetical protein [Holophagales bacterium]